MVILDVVEPRNAGPFQPYAKTPFAAPQARRESGVREESDDYGGVVAVLNPKLRVIRSRCNLQWIAQRQNGNRNGAPIWTSFAYCATREGLLMRASASQWTFVPRESDLRHSAQKKLRRPDR